MKLSVRQMAIAGLLGAISFIMGYVFPILGFVPVPTAAGHATLMHIPAILGAVAEGPVVGGFIGLIFGLLSWLRPGAPFFADPLISVLPRIFIGITAYYAWVGLRRFGLVSGLVGSAIVGTLTNTVLVLGMVVLRGHMAAGTALVTGLVHGVPEVVVAALVVTAIGMGLFRAGFIKGPGNATKKVA